MSGDRANLSPLFSWRSAICDSDLPATARHVALTLSIYMNERGGSAYPGGTRLKNDTGLSLRTVRTALATLEGEGWLTVARRGGALPGQPRTATEYRATVPTRATAAPVTEPDAPVQQLHGCISGHRPVQLTTLTGAAVAPQDAMKATGKAPLAPAVADAVDNDALRSAVITDCRLDPERMTASASGALNKAVGDLAAAGARADAVPAAAARFRSRFPSATLTPLALAKHWPQLGGGSTQRSFSASPAERLGSVLALTVADPAEARRAAEDELCEPEAIDEAMRAWNRRRESLTEQAG